MEQDYNKNNHPESIHDLPRIIKIHQTNCLLLVCYFVATVKRLTKE